ncbi:hypothetical protein Tco_1360631 [Tanacetum coccineum]
MRRVGKGFSGRETPLFQAIVVQEQAEMGEGSANPTDPHHTPTIIQPSPQPQKKQKPRKPKRKDTQIPQSSVPIEHDSSNIIKTRSKATPNEVGSLGTTSGGGPRCQETMRDTIAQTGFESVSKLFNDPLLARVLDFGKTKTIQVEEIVSLKRRVKKLEQKKGEDASKQGRINAIDADEDITLVNDQDDADMFDVNTRLLMRVKPKVKANVVEEPSVPVSAASTKRLEEPVKSMKKKDLVRLDEEIASKLQAKFDEDERLKREKDKMFDKTFKRVNTFVEFRTDLVEETVEVDNDQEAAKIKELIEIVPDKEEVAIDAIPLAVKPPIIKIRSNVGREEISSYTLLKLQILLNKKLNGRIVGIKRLHDDLEVTAAKWDQQVVSELTLIDETQGRYGDDLMFDTGVLDKEAVFAGQDMDEKEINVAETEVSTADPVTTTSEVVTITIDDLTLAQTLIEIKRAKSKVKGVMIGE